MKLLDSPREYMKLCEPHSETPTASFGYSKSGVPS